MPTLLLKWQRIKTFLTKSFHLLVFNSSYMYFVCNLLITTCIVYSQPARLFSLNCKWLPADKLDSRTLWAWLISSQVKYSRKHSLDHIHILYSQLNNQLTLQFYMMYSTVQSTFINVIKIYIDCIFDQSLIYTWLLLVAQGSPFAANGCRNDLL